VSSSAAIIWPLETSEGIDDVAELLIAADIFRAFENAAALAAGVLDPDASCSRS